jgi:hypothetical protein
VAACIVVVEGVIDEVRIYERALIGEEVAIWAKGDWRSGECSPRAGGLPDVSVNTRGVRRGRRMAAGKNGFMGVATLTMFDIMRPRVCWVFESRFSY